MSSAISRTVRHGFCRLTRACPGFWPVMTKGLFSRRGRESRMAMAGSFNEIDFCPVLESGRKMRRLSISIYSHLRLRISPSRAPVKMRSRIAAIASTLRTPLFSTCSMALPSRPNSTSDKYLSRRFSGYFLMPTHGVEDCWRCRHKNTAAPVRLAGQDIWRRTGKRGDALT